MAIELLEEGDSPSSRTTGAVSIVDDLVIDELDCEGVSIINSVEADGVVEVTKSDSDEWRDVLSSKFNSVSVEMSEEVIFVGLREDSEESEVSSKTTELLDSDEAVDSPSISSSDSVALDFGCSPLSSGDSVGSTVSESD